MSNSPANSSTTPNRRRLGSRSESQATRSTIADLPLLVRIPSIDPEEPTKAPSVQSKVEPDSSPGTTAASSEPASDALSLRQRLTSSLQHEFWLRTGWRVLMLGGAVVLMLVAYRVINRPGVPMVDSSDETNTQPQSPTSVEPHDWSIETRQLTPEESPSVLGNHEPFSDEPGASLPRYATGEPGPVVAPVVDGTSPRVVTPHPDALRLEQPRVGQSVGTGSEDSTQRPWSPNPAEQPRNDSLHAQGIGFRQSPAATEGVHYPTTNPNTWRDFSQPVAPYYPPQSDHAAHGDQFPTNQPDGNAPSWRREQPGVARLRGEIDDAPLR